MSSLYSILEYPCANWQLQLHKLFLKAIMSFRKSFKALGFPKTWWGSERRKGNFGNGMESHLYTMVLSLLYTFQPIKRRLHHQQGVLKAFLYLVFTLRQVKEKYRQIRETLDVKLPPTKDQTTVQEGEDESRSFLNTSQFPQATYSQYT